MIVKWEWKSASSNNMFWTAEQNQSISSQSSNQHCWLCGSNICLTQSFTCQQQNKLAQIHAMQFIKRSFMDKNVTALMVCETNTDWHWTFSDISVPSDWSSHHVCTNCQHGQSSESDIFCYVEFAALKLSLTCNLYTVLRTFIRPSPNVKFKPQPP